MDFVPASSGSSNSVGSKHAKTRLNHSNPPRCHPEIYERSRHEPDVLPERQQISVGAELGFLGHGVSVVFVVGSLQERDDEPVVGLEARAGLPQRAPRMVALDSHWVLVTPAA